MAPNTRPLSPTSATPRPTQAAAWKTNRYSRNPAYVKVSKRRLVSPEQGSLPRSASDRGTKEGTRRRLWRARSEATRGSVWLGMTWRSNTHCRRRGWKQGGFRCHLWNTTFPRDARRSSNALLRPRSCDTRRSEGRTSSPRWSGPNSQSLTAPHTTLQIGSRSMDKGIWMR